MEYRDTNIYKAIAKNLDKTKMKIPYMYIHDQYGYSVKSIYRRFITQSDADLGIYPNTFPNNIKEHFWIQEGKGSLQHWISVGQLKSGLYFYFTAFSLRPDGQFYINKTVTGHMNLWLSRCYKDIIQFAMDAEVYKKYISEMISLEDEKIR